MLTVITRVKLAQGAEAEWDQAMRERLESTDGKPGWVRGQLLTPQDGRNGRVIVGTWESQADWKAWHEDETFKRRGNAWKASRRARTRWSGSRS